MSALKRCLSIAGLLVLGSCNTDRSPTSPFSCVPLTGQYTGAFTDSCGLSRAADVTLFQTGCTVVAEFPGVGSLQGTVQGQTLIFAIGFSGFSPCGGSASGSATVTSQGGLSGAYSGQATGTGATCCGSVSGTFTLTRR
ncbi:MAG: hypothetical protein NEA02_17905 [Thermoanaerobaculia bacterium]|nr:hypothetical protein [Thermoanaerobaculia bacterium]